MRFLFALIVSTAVLIIHPLSASAQLSLSWMLPAVAHTAGSQGSFWMSDVSLHNPHDISLPVVIQFLPSDRENWSAPTLDVTLYPWETLNLWDVLGPEIFDEVGTGALLIYADPSLPCSEAESCDFLVSSRTYTVAPDGGAGEYGQAIPAFSVFQGTDWTTYGYATGILNDGASFRCNVGAASWSSEWVTVQVDVQDAEGYILDTEFLDIPPFGHVQQRLGTAVEGGTLVFYLSSQGDDPLVFPYASVVNQATNDPSFFFAQPSGVGTTKAARAERSRTERPFPGVQGEIIALKRSAEAASRAGR